jgi:hypothetical protein
MTHQKFFCSELARERGEQIFGTAPHVNTWLLLEQPGSWSARSLPDEGLPDAVRKRFESLAEAIPRGRRLLIRQRHRHLDEVQFFVAHSREHSPELRRFTWPSQEGLLLTDASMLVDGGEASWTQPLFLVCTQGRHDKCCAKFGLCTYRRLREVASDDTWECTHVGGDRFAGNVVCLPHGIYYGNVFPEDGPVVAAAYQRGEIVLKHYRGRSCYSRVAQVGEYFVRHESGITRLDDLSFRESERVAEGRWRVRFAAEQASEIHEVEFVIQKNPPVHLTCKSLGIRSVSQYALREYRVVKP